jgi:hypothetical protein
MDIDGFPMSGYFPLVTADLFIVEDSAKESLLFVL